MFCVQQECKFCLNHVIYSCFSFSREENFTHHDDSTPSTSIADTREDNDRDDVDNNDEYGDDEDEGDYEEIPEYDSSDVGKEPELEKQPIIEELDVEEQKVKKMKDYESEEITLQQFIQETANEDQYLITKEQFMDKEEDYPVKNDRFLANDDKNHEEQNRQLQGKSFKVIFLPNGRGEFATQLGGVDKTDATKQKKEKVKGLETCV